MGEYATSSFVSESLQQYTVNYVSGLGHGSYGRFTGFKGSVIWTADVLTGLEENGSLKRLKGKVVHLLSCETGASRGHKMVEHRALAFWGYAVNFMFPISKVTPEELVSDPLPELFLKMDAIIDRGILSGRDSDVIYDAVDAM